MKRRGLLIVLIVLVCWVKTIAQNTGKHQEELQLLADHVFSLSEVMLHDVANPPAASRFYAYAMLGAYEAAFFGQHQLPDINLKLNVDPGIEPIMPPKNFNLSFCTNYTMLSVGRQIMPSGPLLEEKQKNLVAYFRKKKKLSKEDIELQIQYAEQIAKQVMQYARKDAYNKLSTYTRYTPSKVEGHWYPTPPEYMGAIEPQWKTIRPFFIDSAKTVCPCPSRHFQ